MQWGGVVMPVFALFAIVVMPILAADDGTSNVAKTAIMAVMVVIFAVVAYFSRLVVVVADGRVTASFGLGAPRRDADLSDVTTVAIVRNRWWHGWGMRRISNGWLYNVWGLDAVELRLASDTIVRIGTDEPEELHGILTLHLQSRRTDRTG